MKITLLHGIYIYKFASSITNAVETNNVNKCHHAMAFVRFSCEHHAPSTSREILVECDLIT